MDADIFFFFYKIIGFGIICSNCFWLILAADCM